MLVCTLHVCLGGLSNDSEIELEHDYHGGKHLLTKLVSISKYGNFSTEAVSHLNS